jgi:glycosyltransferase involved in cell wall biosynthesis
MAKPPVSQPQVARLPPGFSSGSVPQSRLRICELVLAPAFGGAETLALALAASFRDAGHAVDVIALDRPRVEAPVLTGEIRVAERPTWAKGEKVGRFAAARLLATSGRYDVIHAHSYLPNLYARAGAASSRTRVPVVVTLLSGSDDFATRSARRVEALLAPWTSAVVAMGDRLCNEYREYFPKLRDRVRVIPVGVQREPFVERDSAKPPTRFALVGRVAPQKDVEAAIRAFATFAESAGDPRVTLSIIGPPSDAEYAGRMHLLADTLAPDSVSFVGARANPFADKTIDVLVHSAVGEAHTPIAVLEAAGHGIPVICRDSGAMAKAIGWHCTTFADGSPEHLARALLRVRNDWSQAIRSARRAWEIVPRFDDTASRYEALLRAVVGPRSAS